MYRNHDKSPSEEIATQSHRSQSSSRDEFARAVFPLDNELSVMAQDGQVQKEMRAIESEFAHTESDGLPPQITCAPTSATTTPSVRMDNEKRQAFHAAIRAMSAFRAAFGRDLSCSFVAELYAAEEFNLEISAGVNQHGFDALDATGLRYQVKQRNEKALNVDVNNFHFDRLVLVNLNDKLELAGMWMLTKEQAYDLFTARAKFRKSQVTQARFKALATRVR